MDVGRRRSDAGVLRTGNSVVAGSAWESRMKIDEVRGGIKVFNGDQDNSEESSTTAMTPRPKLKRGPASNGKRKTWKSETSPIQMDKGKSESESSVKNSDEQCKELSVSVVDGIKNSPSQVRSVRRLRSEGSKETPNGVAASERSPVGIRKPRIELQKSASDLGKDEGIERNLGQLRKVKSESIKGNAASGNAAIQLRKVKSESNKAASDEFDKGTDESVEIIEKSPVEDELGKSGSEENCKEFGVCKEMVIPSNVDVVISDPKELVNDGDDEEELEEEEEEEEKELEEEVNEEIEVDVEVEKKSIDIKEINAPVEEKLSKVVNEVKKFQFARKSRTEEVKKLQQVRQKPETISLNLKKQSPVMKRAAVYSNVPKYTSYAASNDQYHHSFPETHSRLQSLVDLIMWKDVSRSVFIFGIGTFVILSSSYMKDLNISFISVISYMGLVYLATIFLFRSIICRGAYEIENANSVVGEEEAIWVLKLVLPYLNEFLLKFKALFSGDPATTIKLAVLLFVLARCGSSITIWTMSKVGFFGVFTVPKVCSLYSTQITIYAKFWVRRFRDAWDSCNHKKAVTVAIFLLVWNLSSVGARIWAAFILAAAFRCYQQNLVTDEWVEDDIIAADEEGAQQTWQGVDIHITKPKKGF